MDEKRSPSKRQQDGPTSHCDTKRIRPNGQHHEANGSSRTSADTGPQSMMIDSPSSSSNVAEDIAEVVVEPGPQPMMIDVTEDIAEVVVEATIDIERNSDKKGMKDVLRKAIALRNSCGGVIKLKHSHRHAEKIHDWIKCFNHKKITESMGETDAHWDTHWKQHDDVNLLFVRKASTIRTQTSGLYLRREKQNEEIRVFEQIKSMLTKDSSRDTSIPCQCHMRKCDQSNTQQWTCLQKDSFKQEGLTESMYVEFKNFPDKDFENLSCLRDKVKVNVTAFSNTDGGTLYIGVKDNGEIVGQVIQNEKDVESQIQDYIRETKCMLYTEYGSLKPVQHCHIRFIPVEGQPTRKVIEIDVCRFDGTVFHSDPIYPTVNENGEIVNMNMPIKEWLSHFQKPAFESQERFTVKKHGFTVYKEIKETMNEILQSLDSSSELQIHPKHANEWINRDPLNRLLEVVQQSMTNRGHIFVQRGWNALLGKPNLIPPSSTICDVLLCSPKHPLVLVTLVESHNVRDQECRDYNNALARTFKEVLAQEAGCVEMFLVKPLVICEENILDGSLRDTLFCPPGCYPKKFSSMTRDKYSKILKSLALVLTKVISSVSVEAGLKHFSILTKDQYDILDEFYGSNSTLEITGLPGTGKTLLALERIERLRIGSLVKWYEILYVCSHKVLEASVRNYPRMSHDGQPLCRVMNYHTLIECLKFSQYEKIDVLKHIVADEVHSYKENPDGKTLATLWRNLMEKENCTFWFFLDNSQKITKEKTVAIPNGVTSRHLKTVIRTTGHVYNFFKRYITTDTSNVKLGHDIQGSVPKILIPNCQPHNMSKELENILLFTLHELIVDQGHSPDNITVLFDDTTAMAKYTAVFKSRAKNLSIKNGEERNDKGVTFETIRRYSGDENTIAIGFCPTCRSPRFQDSNALMASLCSRPKLELILVFASQQISKQFRIKDREWTFCSPPEKKIYDFSSSS